MLLTGLTLLALFYAWSPGTSSVVDVWPRQGNQLQKLLDETNQGIISGHHNDIAYHIKEDVARCVITQRICSFVFIQILLWILVINFLSTYYHFFSHHSRLALNTCVCLADKDTLHLPFSNLLFSRVWAHNVSQAFLESHPDPEAAKSRRAQEYNSFERRYCSRYRFEDSWTHPCLIM